MISEAAHSRDEGYLATIKETCERLFERGGCSETARNVCRNNLRRNMQFGDGKKHAIYGKNSVLACFGSCMRINAMRRQQKAAATKDTVP
jgi:hypothetical protein